MQHPFTISLRAHGLFKESEDCVIYEPSRVVQRPPEVKWWRGQWFLRTICGPYVVISRVPMDESSWILPRKIG